MLCPTPRSQFEVTMMDAGFRTSSLCGLTWTESLDMVGPGQSFRVHFRHTRLLSVKSRERKFVPALLSGLYSSFVHTKRAKSREVIHIVVGRA